MRMISILSIICLSIHFVSADDCSDIDCGSATNSATCIAVCAGTEGCKWDTSGYAFGSTIYCSCQFRYI